MTEISAFTILVCGSRGFADYETVANCLATYDNGAPNHIISGGCPSGADRLVEIFVARHQDWTITVVPADWTTHGKKAGFIRNQQMIDMNPDLVLAFWDGASRGTAHTLNLAKKRKIPTLIVYH